MATPEATGNAGPKPRANPRRRVVRVALILLVLCLIYVLSAGPFAALVVATSNSLDDLRFEAFGTVFYAPLYYCGRDTPLRGPFKMYVYWWAGLGQWFRPLPKPNTVHHPRPENSYGPNFPTD